MTLITAHLSEELITSLDRAAEKLNRSRADVVRQAEEPHAGSALKGEFAGLRRVRVGDYRVIYEVDEGVLLVLVVRNANRRDTYR